MSRDAKFAQAKMKLARFQKGRQNSPYSLHDALSGSSFNGLPVAGLGLASSTSISDYHMSNPSVSAKLQDETTEKPLAPVQNHQTNPPSPVLFSPSAEKSSPQTLDEVISYNQKLLKKIAALEESIVSISNSTNEEGSFNWEAEISVKTTLLNEEQMKSKLLENDLASAIAQKAQLELELQNLTAEYNQLKNVHESDLNNRDFEISNLQSQLQTYQVTIHNLQEQLNHAQNTIDTLNESKSLIENEIQLSNGELTENHIQTTYDESSVTDGELVAHDNKVHNAVDVNISDSSVLELAKLNESIKNHISIEKSLREQIETLSTQIAESETSLQSYQNEIARLENCLVTQTHLASDLQKQVQNIQESSNIEITRLMDRITELENAIEASQNRENDEFSDERYSLQVQVETYRVEAEQLRDVTIELEKKISIFESEKQSPITYDLQQMKNDILKMESEQESLLSSIKELSFHISNVYEQYSTEKFGELESLESIDNTLTTQFQNLSDKVRALIALLDTRLSALATQPEPTNRVALATFESLKLELAELQTKRGEEVVYLEELQMINEAQLAEIDQLRLQSESANNVDPEYVEELKMINEAQLAEITQLRNNLTAKKSSESQLSLIEELQSKINVQSAELEQEKQKVSGLTSKLSYSTAKSPKLLPDNQYLEELQALNEDQMFELDSLKQDLQLVQIELKKKDEELALLKTQKVGDADLMDVNARVEELEMQNDEHLIEIEILQSTISQNNESHNQSVAKYIKEIEKLKDQLEKTPTGYPEPLPTDSLVIDELQASYDEQQLEMDILTSQFQDLEAKYKDSNAELETTRQALECIQVDFAGQSKAMEDLKHQISAYTYEIQELKQNNATSPIDNQTIDELQTTIEIQNSEIESLRSNIKELEVSHEVQLANLNDQLTAQLIDEDPTALIDLQIQNDLLIKEIEDLKLYKESSDTTREQLKSLEKTHKEKLKAVQNESNLLVETMRNLTEQNSELKDQTEKLELDSVTHLRAIESLQNSNSSLKLQFEQLEQDLNEANVHIETLETVIQTNTDKFQEMLTSLEVEKTNLQAEITDLKIKCENQSSDLLKNEVDALVADLADSEARIVKLEELINANNTQYQSMLESLTKSHESEKIGFLEKIDQLTLTSQAISNDHETQMRAEIENLKLDLVDSEERVTELEVLITNNATQYQTMLEKMNYDTEELRQELSTINATLEQKQSELNQMNIQYESLYSEADVLKIEIQKMSQLNEQSQNDLEMVKTELDAKSSMIETMEVSLVNVKEEMETIKQDKKTAEDHIAQLESVIEQNRSQYDSNLLAEQTRIFEYESALQSREQDLQNSLQTTLEKQNEIEQLQLSLAQLHQDRDNLVEVQVLTEAEEHITNLEAIIEENSSKFQTLLDTEISTRNQLEARITELEAQISILNESRDQLVEQKTLDLKTSISQLEQTIQETDIGHKALVDEMEREKQQLKENIQDLEIKLEDARSETQEVSDLKSDLEIKKQQLISLESQVVELQDSITANNAKSIETKESIDELQSQVEKLTQEHIAAQEQLVAAQATITQWEEYCNNSLAEQANYYQQLIDENSKSNESYTMEIASQAAKLLELENELKEKVAELEGLTTGESVFQGELESVQAELDTAQNELENHKHLLAQERERIDQLTSKLGSLKDHEEKYDGLLKDHDNLKINFTALNALVQKIGVEVHLTEAELQSDVNHKSSLILSRIIQGQSMEEKFSVLQNDFDSVKYELSSKCNEVETLQLHQQELYEQNEVLLGRQSDVEGLKAQLEDTYAALHTKDQELMGLQDNLVMLQNELENVHSQDGLVSQKDEEINTLTENLCQLEMQLKESKEKSHDILAEKDSKIEELETKLVEVEATNSNLSSALEELQTTSTTNNEFKEKEEAYQGQLETLKNEKLAIETELESLRQDTASLNEQLAVSTSINQDWQQYGVDAENQKAELFAQNEAFASELESLKSQLTQLHSDTLQSESTTQLRIEELESYQTANVELLEKINDRDLKIDSLSQDLNRLTLDLQNSNDELNLLKASYSKLTTANTSDQEKYQKRNQSLNEELNRCIEALNQTTSEFDILKTQCDALYEEKTRLGLEVSSQGALAAQLQARLDECDETIRSLRQESSTMTSQLTSHKEQRHSGDDSELQAAYRHIEVLQSDITELATLLKNSEQQLIEQQKGSNDTSHGLGLDRHIKQLQTVIEECERQNQSLQDYLQSVHNGGTLDVLVEQLQRSLEEEVQSNTKLRNALTDSQNDLLHLQNDKANEIARLNEEFDELARLYETATNEIKMLDNRLVTQSSNSPDKSNTQERVAVQKLVSSLENERNRLVNDTKQLQAKLDDIGKKLRISEAKLKDSEVVNKEITLKLENATLASHESQAKYDALQLELVQLKNELPQISANGQSKAEKDEIEFYRSELTRLQNILGYERSKFEEDLHNAILNEQRMGQDQLHVRLNELRNQFDIRMDQMVCKQQDTESLLNDLERILVEEREAFHRREDSLLGEIRHMQGGYRDSRFGSSSYTQIDFEGERRNLENKVYDLQSENRRLQKFIDSQGHGFSKERYELMNEIALLKQGLEAYEKNGTDDKSNRIIQKLQEQKNALEKILSTKESELRASELKVSQLFNEQRNIMSPLEQAEGLHESQLKQEKSRCDELIIKLDELTVLNKQLRRQVETLQTTSHSISHHENESLRLELSDLKVYNKEVMFSLEELFFQTIGGHMDNNRSKSKPVMSATRALLDKYIHWRADLKYQKKYLSLKVDDLEESKWAKSWRMKMQESDFVFSDLVTKYGQIPSPIRPAFQQTRSHKSIFMGSLQGRVMGNEMVIMDSFALPVEGTETRVSAQNEGYEYMVKYMTQGEEVGRLENAIGWYHSHPGYGCWLSGIDVGTQTLNQTYSEPFVALVVDPNRTISAGKVEIGAFRTYPADERLLETLWNKYWINTLSSSHLVANWNYIGKQMLDLSKKIESAESKMGLMVPFERRERNRDSKTDTKETPLSKTTADSLKIASEAQHGLISQVLKDLLFNQLSPNK
ncbi:hypothetical protein HDV02_000031 [Globomyces sp. JEL0801]|nr:hypothetical protein HDV02_000031 [Globomyces sp. JEL0801]